MRGYDEEGARASAVWRREAAWVQNSARYPRRGAGMTEEAGRGYDEEGARASAVWRRRSGLGAELGEIPAAERGYDGGGGARVWRRCVRRCDGGGRAGMTRRGRGVVGGVAARSGLGAGLGEIPAASAGMTRRWVRGYDGGGGEPTPKHAKLLSGPPGQPSRMPRSTPRRSAWSRAWIRVLRSSRG